MKQLDFTLSMVDKLTRPLKRAQAGIKNFANTAKESFTQIAVGGAALYGVGQTIKGALSPAMEMYDALQEAAANGIDTTAMKSVRNEALLFSSTYGTSAVEFVQSTQLINGAIDGLSGSELPKVTKVANTLAVALKATAAESSEFMGQMYSNFSADAARMGKVKFAEEIAGKATYMRKAFGLEMGKIKDLMEGSKGAGANFGVGMDEQLAVIGQLQRSLGTEASGAYESFLTSAQAGAKKLGMSFTDAGGKMLSMPQMMLKLQARYGKSIEGNIKAQAELDAAFGSGSAVIKQMYGHVDSLQKNINALGSSDGLKRTQEMAAKMVKPWDRFLAILKNIQIVIGLTLMPVLNPMLNRLAEMGQTFARWMQMFPNIARVIGYAVMALLGFAAVGAVTNIVMGVSRFVMLGLTALWRGLTAVTKINTAITWLSQKATFAWCAIMRVMRGVLLAVRIASVLTGAAINFMSWPILLIIGAIALLAAGCYLLITHWDDVKAAVMNTTAFKLVARYVKWLGGVFSSVWKFIAQGWKSFTDLLANFSPMKALAGMAQSITGLFDGIWEAVKKSFTGSWDWIVGKLNKIPGVNIATSGDTPPPPTTNTLSTGGELKGLESGGISKAIQTNSKAITDNSRKIGTVNIHQKEAMTPGQLMEWQELN